LVATPVTAIMPNRTIPVSSPQARMSRNPARQRASLLGRVKYRLAHLQSLGLGRPPSSEIGAYLSGLSATRWPSSSGNQQGRTRLRLLFPKMKMPVSHDSVEAETPLACVLRGHTPTPQTGNQQRTPTSNPTGHAIRELAHSHPQ
jgi:hypothetical protein